jgi:cytochrome bd-type quinol oxidase subunit 2
MTAHSSWVLALAEGGPVALVLLLSLWVYSALCAWSIREREPEYFLAILGYAVAISFLSHTYLLYPYILLSISITHAKAAHGARA